MTGRFNEPESGVRLVLHSVSLIACICRKS